MIKDSQSVYMYNFRNQLYSMAQDMPIPGMPTGAGSQPSLTNAASMYAGLASSVLSLAQQSLSWDSSDSQIVGSLTAEQGAAKHKADVQRGTSMAGTVVGIVLSVLAMLL